MKLLIDSSTNYSFLALYDNQVIDTMVRQGKNDHSETLIDCLEKLLEKHSFYIYEWMTAENIQGKYFAGRGKELTAFEHINYVTAVFK